MKETNTTLNDQRSEEILISQCFRDPAILSRRDFTTSAFFDEELAKIASHMLACRNSGEPVTSDSVRLRDDALFQRCEKLSSFKLASTSPASLIQKIQDLHTRRKISRFARTVYESCFDIETELEAIVSQMESQALTVASSDTESAVAAGWDVSELNEELKWQAEHVGEIRGVRWGMSETELLLNGIQGGWLYVIGARPSVGKTALAVSMIAGLLDRYVKTAIFSTEMKRVRIQQRLMGVWSGVSATIARERAYTSTEQKALMQATSKIAKATDRFWIDDSGRPDIDSIISKSRRLHSETGVEVIFVDYIQNVRCARVSKYGKKAEIDEISGALKGLAEDYNIAVISLAQLKRLDKHYDKARKASVHQPPTLDDLKESGAIEQDADVVGLLDRDQSVQALYATMDWAKNRDGKTDKIALAFEPKTMTFSESKD